ncbi:meiotically up-regulated gene 113-domain-containing protein [Aspergillus aurantiobrunneus]
MPYINNTPESKISRSDSKNPATTCRGITTSGLPCRRALASSPDSSPPRTVTAKANVRPYADITALYCWQHRDQAEAILHQTTWTSNPAQKQRRSSIDTLMDRLGVLDINDAPGKHSYPQKKKQTKRSFCCFDIIKEDEPLAPKPRPARPPGQAKPAHPQQMHQVSTKPNSNTPTAQKTNNFLQWIPPSLSPQTKSFLLTELTKPISAADEPGYIYMFWVTPSTSQKSNPPPLDIASSLLPSANRDISADPDESDESPDQIQRSNTAIRRARDLNTLSSNSTPTSPGTVRLKIGRTSNVTRRLNEWTRQCSNDLTLIRYYPYISSSERRQGQGVGKAGLEPGRKVPHVHRVERLIHIELADIRARDLGPCQECGKEHREWFEVAAERTALKRVDECIRRWVRWAHTQQ